MQIGKLYGSVIAGVSDAVSYPARREFSAIPLRKLANKIDSPMNFNRPPRLFIMS